MSFEVRFTEEAADDLERLYAHLVVKHPSAATDAFKAIEKGWRFLELFPFSCRKVSSSNPFLREIIIPFGSRGYVALFEIENNETVTVLAIRHQLEQDYH